jgi:hypothetical protein
MTQSSAIHHGVLRRFVIDTTHCELKVGDYVYPGTAIGNDPETGAMIRSGLSGQVAAIYASHQDTILVFVRDVAS